MGVRLGTLLGMGSKETWALISIMVYAFVIHARRFVPEENEFSI
jgi:ABC-type transport system involved in cytochrome c biogenesis permease subunit